MISPARPNIAGSELARVRRRGFTLLELTIVVAIILVIAAVAMPNMLNVIANTKLRSAMASLSGMMQDCRMLAVKRNRVMSVNFTVLSNGPLAYVKPGGDTSAVTATDPQVQLGSPITKMTTPTGTGAPPQIDSSILGFTPQTGDPSFNPRGLPCTYTSGVCTGNVGFVYYFAHTRSLNPSGWAAVTVSPAGRVKTWYWTGQHWGD